MKHGCQLRGFPPYRTLVDEPIMAMMDGTAVVRKPAIELDVTATAGSLFHMGITRGEKTVLVAVHSAGKLMKDKWVCNVST